MARKSAPGTLIHCEYCGEDFSATYKRCPFCGEKPGENAEEIPPRARDDKELEDEYVFDGGDVFDEPEEDEEEQPAPRKGEAGRRAIPKKGIAVNWPRLVTFICSLVIIVAALVIVFAYIYPKIHGHSSTGGTGSAPSSSVAPQNTPSTAPSAVPSESAEPSQSVEPSQPVDPDISQPPAESGAVVGGNVVSVKLNRSEFTLLADEAWTVSATIDPEGWNGEVEWSVSNAAIVKLDNKGRVKDKDGKYVYQCEVSNTNTGKNVLRTTVTVTAGDKTAEVTVYCRPGSTPSSGLGNGATGTITGVSTTLRVRSGPGTTYDKVGVLKAGAKVTIVADAGNGWYEIDFEGGSGFIMGEYIKVN